MFTGKITLRYIFNNTQLSCLFGKEIKLSKKYLFTSESVTEGHPDKMCDIISDAILNEYMVKDPYARVACEVMATTGVVFVMGEITSKAQIDIPLVVRETVKEIGYQSDKFGFNGDTCGVISAIDKQSDDIDMGVSASIEDKAGQHIRFDKEDGMDEKDKIGAGDQGMMFGYACDETNSYMPAPIYYAHELCKKLSIVRRTKDFLGPDGKSMVTFEYQENKPVRIESIVVSVQHIKTVSQDEISQVIIHEVIKPTIPEEYLDDKTKILINPTGRFVKGGPCADTGLTGRKIIVDTYGGMGRHGGGAFSGKDPTKVDRTGAYAARYVAKNIVAAGIAKRCEVQIAYAIGVSHPVSVNVNTFGTSHIPDETIGKMIDDIFDLRPAALMEQFDMRKPIYKHLASYGHMGREDLSVGWEELDKVNEIKEYLSK